MPILKLRAHHEARETSFELRYLRSLTTQQRFQLMLRKSHELQQLLVHRGHRTTPQIIKRT